MFVTPADYKLKILPETTEVAIKNIKNFVQSRLFEVMNLRRVTAPLFVLSGTGLNDDLNGVERPVNFDVPALGGRNVEIVQSLAKWKRVKLGEYDVARGYGIYTDMNAIRPDEELDNLHSLYVDQWDWEMVISREDRNLDFLKGVVRKVYSIVRDCEQLVYAQFPHITPVLPGEITFVHAEDLVRLYPGMSAKEREREVTRKYGAVFIIGIGAALSDGEPHDKRAPDYDDWTTPCADGHVGLNGDILVWDEVLDCALELSSMGIRVDEEALKRQLKLCGCEERKTLYYHRSLLEGKLPQSLGGGIGQSRLCMFLLRKAHIGEVQSSVWPDDQLEACRKAGIPIL